MTADILMTTLDRDACIKGVRQARRTLHRIQDDPVYEPRLKTAHAFLTEVEKSESGRVVWVSNTPEILACYEFLLAVETTADDLDYFDRLLAVVAPHFPVPWDTAVRAANAIGGKVWRYGPALDGTTRIGPQYFNAIDAVQYMGVRR